MMGLSPIVEISFYQVSIYSYGACQYLPFKLFLLLIYIARIITLVVFTLTNLLVVFGPSMLNPLLLPFLFFYGWSENFVLFSFGLWVFYLVSFLSDCSGIYGIHKWLITVHPGTCLITPHYSISVSLLSVLEWNAIDWSLAMRTVLSVLSLGPYCSISTFPIWIFPTPYFLFK